MPIRLRRDVMYLLAGSTGSGKTEFLKARMLPTFLKQRNTYIVIIDAKGEYEKVSRSQTDLSGMLDLNDALYGAEKPVSRVLRVVPDDVGQDYAEGLLKAAWGPFSRNLSKTGEPFAIRFILDDAPLWYRETGGRGNERQLYRWLGTGRRFLRGFLGVTQRLQLTPKIMLTESTEMTIAFRLSRYDVKRALEPLYGPEVGSAVRSLPKWGYAIISDLLPEGVEVYSPIPNKGMPKQERGIALPE